MNCKCKQCNKKLDNVIGSKFFVLEEREMKNGAYSGYYSEEIKKDIFCSIECLVKEFKK